MAASIYATPPPDLSSEDTALSDVSNSSTLNTNRGGGSSNNSSSNTNNHSNNNNNSNSHTLQPNEATADATTSTMSPTQQLLLDTEPKSKPGSSTNEADIIEDEADGDGEADSTAMAAMAAAAANAAAMQLQLLEALNDAAKKRRKQHNPSRLEALNLSGGETEEGAAETAPNAVVDYEEKLSKMLLPKSIEKLKETFELLQQQKLQPEDISDAEEKQQQQQQDQSLVNPYQTYCKQCGENFETEFKLSLHMLQDHQQQHQQEQQQQLATDEPMDLLSSIKVKLERADSPTQLELQQQQQQLELTNGHSNNNKEHELWLQAMAQQHHQQQQQHQQQPGLPGMPPAFAFPPEAAALGWPLLGMPGFPGVEGLNRPPLRIFNPEAYCELCNKEFCNKYFLKTHKANKHGIFDPAGDLASTPNNNISNMNNNNNNNSNSNNNHNGSNNSNNNVSSSSSSSTSMFQQLQMPREVPPPPPQKPEPQLTPPAPPAVHCDICSKRFTNIFAMRRHRAKQHEQATPTASPTPQPRRGSPNERQSPVQAQPVKLEPLADTQSVSEIKPYQLPDGFREDFTLEQEELSFAPPPRKLPAQLQQQARESNCAPDKLRRLGVLLPEAFCELCCKEYANRYFLRTHKWKRHGVFVPPEDLQLGGKEEQPQMPAGWPFMPLNLMLAKAAAEHEQQPEQENQNEDELLLEEQPSKRIKLEPYDESMPAEKVDNSVMGLQNLQKLQSMLQQLNDFNGKRPLPCHLCGRELEHQYALRAHLMTEHASQLLPEGHPMLYQQQQQQLPLKLSPAGGGSPTAAAAATPTPNELRCQPCEREFANSQEFKQHIAEVHLGRIPTSSSSPLREGFYTPERATVPPIAGAPPGPPRGAYTITPTSSYCEICNKELCNKYFMKTHMQRMHGIEIENGAQIGGVVCNICNKELCSKYFLRVHKHNTHGIIEDGAPLPQPRGQNSAQNGIKADAQQQQQQQQQQQLLEPEVNLTTLPSDSSATNELCPLCARQFRSAKWLRTHLMNEHGAAGVEKLRELELQQQQPPSSTGSKPNSPTLKIPNGNPTGANNLAQALQNAQQQLFGQMQLPKGMPLPLPLPGMFEQTPRFKEYQCSLCPFTTPYYAFLFIHERSHALLNTEETHVGAEAELPRNDRDRSFALVQGKARTKPSKERADVEIEPTNLTTNNSNSKTATPTTTPTTLPSPGAVAIVAGSPKVRSATVTPIPRRRSTTNTNTTTITTSPKPGTPNGLGAQRSAATSPFEMCSDLANGSGKPASYAQPDKAEEAYQMQAFHLAPADADAEGLFAPALVYLPVRVRASESTTLSFRLTPA
ncbi:alpha-protein kinase 1 [Drosophila grimshawi]|uniref:alpha-protein kinase 1 n=1 Tax=Drosophila grimshawi TaxID=7222 RepID=UPI000C86F763|nr:alpha-protein kinase 1 [Drosophila grimshawi]